jgi:outer membrane biosynthesis protein TonB
MAKMHKIESELAEIAEVKREKGEEDQAFFGRAVKAVNKALDKDEELWDKLGDATQKWINAATTASDAGTTVPNFDGEVVEEGEKEEAAEEDTAGEKEGAEAAKEEEEPRRSRPKAKEKAPAKEKTKEKTPAKAKEKEKAPAKEKAKKADKTDKTDKTDGAKRGRKGGFSETDKIKAVIKENPFREGTKAADCFDTYKKCVGKTVADVLKAGVPRSKLNRHIKKKIVTLA